MNTITFKDEKALKLVKERDELNKTILARIIALQLEEQEVKKLRLNVDKIQMDLFPIIDKESKSLKENEVATTISISEDGKKIIFGTDRE